MICAGIDAGSRAVKIVFLDSKSLTVMAQGTTDQGVEQERIAGDLFARLLDESRLAPSRVERIIATGCSRHAVGMAHITVTEICCHARGVRHLVPQARSIVEIGGQDSKIIHLGDDGSVRDFSMNDRCAAGTGRFLEVLADRLGVDLQTIGAMALRSGNPAIISSMCAVFAETEIIGLLAEGVHPDDIAAGVQASVAARLAGMTGRGLTEPLIFTGGVALVPGMDKALEKALKSPVIIPSCPQMTGALGAAIIAAR